MSEKKCIVPPHCSHTSHLLLTLSMCDHVSGGNTRVESSVLVLVVAGLILPALDLLGQ